MIGWHFYMTPEDAARGLLILNDLPDVNADGCSHRNYIDVSKFEVFK